MVIMKIVSVLRSVGFYICCFFVFCVIGWLYESIWSSLNHGYFVNKGFLYGFYLPIYGFGGVTLILCLNKLMSSKIHIAKIPITPIVVFGAAMVIISSIEFVVSYVMELIYHRRWWDYSKVDKLHVDGRISLRNSTILTSGSMVFLYGVYPLMKKLLCRVKTKIIVSMAIVIVVVMGADTVLTILFRH